MGTQTATDRRTCLYVGGHRLFREAMRVAMSRSGVSVEPVVSVQEALDRLAAGDAHGALIDDGGLEDERVLDTVETLLRRNPDLKIGGISDRRSPVLPAEMIRAGACGFMLKDAPLSEFRFELERMLQGHLVVDPVVARPLFGFLDGDVAGAGPAPNGNGNGSHITALSAVERKVLQHASDGLLNKQIAHEMGLSPLTVKNHLARIRAKLGASTTTHAVAIALRSGLLD